jgi:hypothetical protein
MLKKCNLFFIFAILLRIIIFIAALIFSLFCYLQHWRQRPMWRRHTEPTTPKLRARTSRVWTYNFLKIFFKKCGFVNFIKVNFDQVLHLFCKMIEFSMYSYWFVRYISWLNATFIYLYWCARPKHIFMDESFGSVD